MALMKRSVNLFLVILIVLSVAVLGGLTLFYQDSFASISDKLHKTEGNLTTCEVTLQDTKNELLSTQVAVSANQEDVDKTVSLFEQKKNELTTTQTQLQKTLDTAKALNATVRARDTQIRDLQGQIDEKNTAITGYKAEISELNDEIDELEDEVAACGP